MRLFISCGLIILLSGCASLTNSYTTTVQSWRGASSASLQKRWGKPDIKVVGQSGNTFYIYRSKTYVTSQPTYSPQVGVNVSPKGYPVIVTTPPNHPDISRPNMPLYCVAAFEVTPSGHIVGAETKGNGCTGGPNFAQKMGNPAVSP